MTHKPKIGFLIQSLSSGGAERAASALANEFSEKGYDSAVLTFSSRDEFYKLNEGVKKIDLDFKEIPKGFSLARLKGTASRFKAIKSEIKKGKIDVLICLSNTMSVYGAFIDVFTKCKAVGTERTNPYLYMASRWKSLLRKISAVICSGFVCQTEKAAAFFPKSVQKKCAVIHNAVFNPLVYELSEPSLRKKTVCAMGRLENYKRFDLLMEAFAEFSKVHPEYNLVIYGEGSERGELEALAQRLNICDKISLPGAELDAIKKANECSIFALTSDFEGMPNALIEAMAAGLACISTDCDMGPSEIIVNNINGILIPTGDKEALVDALIKIADDEAFAASLGERAAEIKVTHNIDSISRKWLDYISSL